MFVDFGRYELEVLDIAPQVLGLPPIALLHEGLGCVAMWRDFPHALAAATGARVVVYSRYGYGHSTPLPTGARNVRKASFMHEEAIEVAPLLFKNLNIENPFLVGHSDGGSIALIHAATFPSAVCGVAVMAPHCFVEELSVRNIAEAKIAFETTDLSARLGKYHLDSAATFYGWNDVWLSTDFRAWNISETLSAITCPVLAIQGEQDEYGTMAQIDVIADRVPTTQLRKLAQCGHSPWKDARETVLTEIVNHFRLCADK